MRIGFLLPANFALELAGNGVRAQARFQAEALERLGHQVVRLDSWENFEPGSVDLVQFFQGAFSTFWIERLRPSRVGKLVFAPMIDSNEPQWRYRLAARLGQLHSRFFTIPGEMARQAAGSDLVVVRSTHERERVIRGLGVDPRRVGVEIVLNGVPSPEPTDPEGVRQRLNLPRDFLLHVSLYGQARKNVARLIRAVGPTELPLIIAGTAEPGPVLDEVVALAGRYPNVRLLGYLDRGTLNSLYAACRVFCMPSEHEGTGLAALEAASYGAGVVITANGGPPDYFIDLGYYVDPFNVEGIRAAVLRAWKEPRGAALQDHVLTRLTWDRSAESLVEAYRKHVRG